MAAPATPWYHLSAHPLPDVPGTTNSGAASVLLNEAYNSQDETHQAASVQVGRVPGKGEESRRHHRSTKSGSHHYHGNWHSDGPYYKVPLMREGYLDHADSTHIDDELLELALQRAVEKSVKEAVRKAVDKALLTSSTSSKKNKNRRNGYNEGNHHGQRMHKTSPYSATDYTKQDSSEEESVLYLTPKTPDFIPDYTDLLIGALVLLGVTLGPQAIIGFIANFTEPTLWPLVPARILATPFSYIMDTWRQLAATFSPFVTGNGLLRSASSFLVQVLSRLLPLGLLSTSGVTLGT